MLKLNMQIRKIELMIKFYLALVIQLARSRQPGDNIALFIVPFFYSFNFLFFNPCIPVALECQNHLQPNQLL